MPLRSENCRVFNPFGWWQDEQGSKPRLLVIGCGPSGIQIVRNLWQEFDVTLIEPKDYYEFTPGILRGLCDPEHLKSLQVPLAEAFKGYTLRHVRGQVTQLGESSAQVEIPGESTVAVEFDFAVVAVGSQYAGTSLWKVTGAESPELSLEKRQEALAQLRQSLAQLRCAVLLGAGLVGVELAAELAHHFPELRLVLVDRAQSVLPNLPKDAQEYAQSWLQDHGVELRLGQELPQEETALLAALDVAGEARVLPCAGLRFACRLAESLGCLDQRGQVCTNRAMQCIQMGEKELQGQPCAGGRIFALGDCVSVQGTEMQFTKDIYPAEAMAEVVVANLRRLSSGGEVPATELQEMASLQEMTLCSLGPSDCIYVMNGRVVTTGWLAMQLKHQVEVTKMGQLRQEMWGSLVWRLVPHW